MAEAGGGFCFEKHLNLDTDLPAQERLHWKGSAALARFKPRAIYNFPFFPIEIDCVMGGEFYSRYGKYM